MRSVQFAAAAMLAWIATAAAQNPNMTVPDVNVTAPGATPVLPPYLRDPGQGGSLRNGFFGRYRNEEEKFIEQPCGTTRLSSSAGAGKCLVGYRLDGGRTSTSTTCDMGLDVVLYGTANLAVEADIVSFDPQKVTAVGHAKCRIIPYKYYATEDFQDMNQVTRRGGNFRNLADVDDSDRRIEFSDGNKACVAMRRLGPPWNGGQVWVMHVSICRTDDGAVSPQDIAATANSLMVRVYDPVGNLRAPPAQLYSPADGSPPQAGR